MSWFRTRWTRWLLLLAFLLPAITAMAMAVHFLGACEGGYKEPFTCSFIPDGVGEAAFNVLFLGGLGSVFWTPVLAILALGAELWARLSIRTPA